MLATTRSKMLWKQILRLLKKSARQLRLRDIGGIIVVDFIDMKLPEIKSAYWKLWKSSCDPDRAKHAVLPISKFGLMQITRQRMKPEMNINTQEVCPTCNGTGKIASTLILEDEIEKNLNYLITHKHRNLSSCSTSDCICLSDKGLDVVQALKMEAKVQTKHHFKNRYKLSFDRIQVFRPPGRRN